MQKWKWNIQAKIKKIWQVYFQGTDLSSAERKWVLTKYLLCANTVLCIFTIHNLACSLEQPGAGRSPASTLHKGTSKSLWKVFKDMFALVQKKIFKVCVSHELFENALQVRKWRLSEKIQEYTQGVSTLTSCLLHLQPPDPFLRLFTPGYASESFISKYVSGPTEHSLWR